MYFVRILRRCLPGIYHSGHISAEGGCVKEIVFDTEGSCASQVIIHVDEGLIVSARFVDGCPGNTQAVAALVAGMSVGEAVTRLKGIVCQGNTSCPDQLAKALEAACL